MSLDVHKVFKYAHIKLPIRKGHAELVSIIDQIKRLDLLKCQIPYIKNLVSKLMVNYHLRVIEINPGVRLYRGIIYDNKPTHVSELSYPPALSAKIGRASNEGESMFYCASDLFVPFYELRAEVGQRFVISQWSVRRKLVLNSLGFTEENFRRLGAVRDNPIVYYPEYDEYFHHPDNLLVHEFFAKMFSREVPIDNPSLYKLSLAIAENFMAGGGFDGLLYPTIAMNANAENLVLRPDVIDSKGIAIEKVSYFEVEKANFKERTYKVVSLDYADSSFTDGRINWTGNI